MRRRHAVFVWGVLLVALFMLSALPVAWASPTQTHGRFTVPTRTPTSLPPTEAPTQEPTDEPPPTQEPTDEPPPSQGPTAEPSPTEEPTAEPPPSDATATPTPLSSTGTHTRTLPTTPTGTPLPTVVPTLTASPTPGEGTPTSTVSPTPGEPTVTLTPTSTAESGEMEPATDFEADATGVLSETTETITVTEFGVTETLTSSPVVTSSQPSALAVTATPSESPSGGTGRNRISPLFLGGLAAIILGILVWFVGKRLGATSSSRDFVSEPNHAVPMDGLSRGAGRQPIETEESQALPSPSSEAYETDRDETTEPLAGDHSEDGGD